jgi:hypothetical protein
MALRKGIPTRFVAAGLSDALDGTDVFPGACSILQNLIPDASTQGVWQPRPAAIKLTSFAGFITPGYISAGYIVGSRFYGLISSGLNQGFDQPFYYELVAGTFGVVSGITGANVPASPPTSGDWEPPTMALVGTKLVVTHPGFGFASGNAFGWFETSNPAAVSWNAGNTTGALVLPARPSSVSQFGGRAWFLVNPTSGQPTAYFTDILSLNITNAGQALTFDDNKPLTAAAGLPLENQLGGIIQSLIVFKDSSNMYQITGDFSLNTLTKNAMNVATGTRSPRSICVTPKGVGFIAPDGARVIDFNARISDPVGAQGGGVNVPFTNALYPTRVSAASNASTYRVSVQNGGAAGTPVVEYWYDLARQNWSGPHTLPTDLAVPYGNAFIIIPHGISASLWQSDVIVTDSATYVENGSTMNCVMQTALLPDNSAMTANQMAETLIEIELPQYPNTVVISPRNEDNTNIAPPVVLADTALASIWGSAVWGVSLWAGATGALRRLSIPWAVPIVFTRMSLYINFTAAANARIGAMLLRHQPIGAMMLTSNPYVMNTVSVAHQHAFLLGGNPLGAEPLAGSTETSP